MCVSWVAAIHYASCILWTDGCHQQLISNLLLVIYLQNWMLSSFFVHHVKNHTQKARHEYMVNTWYIPVRTSTVIPVYQFMYIHIRPSTTCGIPLCRCSIANTCTVWRAFICDAVCSSLCIPDMPMTFCRVLPYLSTVQKEPYWNNGSFCLKIFGTWRKIVPFLQKYFP